MTRSSGFHVPAVLAVAALALAACGGGSDDSAPVTDAPSATEAAATSDPPPTDAPTTDPVDASRCGVVVDRDDDIDEYDPISCAEPHDAEFAGFETTTSDPAAPDDLESRIELMQLCAPLVEALTNRTLTEFGVDVGAVRDADSSDAGNVECWAAVATPEALRGSLTEVDFGTALGDAIFLQSEVGPGACFVSFDLGYDLVTAADCETAGAEQMLAVVTLPGDEYPGEDELLDAAYELCDAAIANVDFELISDAYNVVYPLEGGWTALGQRSAICVMAPAGDAAEPDAPQAGADDPCAGSSDDFYPAVPCDEPHHAEFAGTVPPPVDVLPDDSDEAELIGVTACRDTVLEFVGVDELPLGVGVGFVVDTDLGEPIENDVTCYVSTSLADGLLGSIAEIGFDAAFQKISVPGLEPGSCFVLGESNFYLAELADCADVDALMFVGTFDLDDGPYPGADPIREIRAVECARVLADSGLAADPTSVSGTFPGEGDWTNLGQRTVACDASPL